MHAIYLINCTSSPILKDLSPYEMLYNKAPSYSHLRVFDCLCYAGTLAATRHKFDVRVVKCVFLGFKSGVKGYKDLNLTTQQFLLSKDVHFYETEFPYLSLNQESTDMF